VNRFSFTLAVFLSCVVAVGRSAEPKSGEIRNNALTAMRSATSFYHKQVSSHGGYVYFYSLDLSQRWGEGVATMDQIWVQPPGTPTVGLAFVKAYEATGEKRYLDAATDAAEALVYGQLQSGGWTNCVDFDPRGRRVYLYRNGNGRGRNTSSLDDGQTQSAIRLLIHVDHVLKFQNKKIHEAAAIALDALLNAQYPNGAFPQVWDDDKMPDPPAMKASYPDYDWRTEGRIKEYWDMYTLNDNVTGYVAETLIDAHTIYNEDRFRKSLERLGGFLLDAQMPDPQPGWAQQYNYEMIPIWARKFEPPGVSGDESQEVMHTLMRMYHVTGDRKYLEPIPRALAWLKLSTLPDGRVARYYELKTNRPLYMYRKGDKYLLTHDDSNLPKHYGWKTESRIEEIKQQYLPLEGRNGKSAAPELPRPTSQNVRRIIEQLDNRGRWVSTYGGERLIGQAKMQLKSEYLSSERFARNLETLSEFVRSSAN